MVTMSAQSDAATLLQHYMRLVFNGAGLKWFGDNDAEMESVVGLIIDAAREELPALDRECWQCKGNGVTTRPDGSTPWVPKDTCGCCNGNGHIITDAGRRVIAFLQRHPAALTRVDDAPECCWKCGGKIRYGKCRDCGQPSEDAVQEGS